MIGKYLVHVCPCLIPTCFKLAFECDKIQIQYLLQWLSLCFFVLPRAHAFCDYKSMRNYRKDIYIYILVLRILYKELMEIGSKEVQYSHQIGTITKIYFRFLKKDSARSVK